LCATTGIVCEKPIKTATCFAELKFLQQHLFLLKQDCAKVPNQKLSDFIFTSLVMITVFEKRFRHAPHDAQQLQFHPYFYNTQFFHPSKVVRFF
jgi:hypothetical protein